jgi:integrase
MKALAIHGTGSRHDGRRHGNRSQVSLRGSRPARHVRLYVRRAGQPKIRIRELPGTPAFLRAYELALRGISADQAPRAPLVQPAPSGTLRWLVEQYYSCAEFKGLGSNTQGVRRALLDRLCLEPKSKDDHAKIGTLPYSMPSQKVRALRDRRADVPEGANGLLKALRHLFQWAVDAKYLVANPAKEVPYIRSGSTGFHTWTGDEVRQFEERHPIGSKARLALAIMLYLGVRRSDAVVLGRQHLRDAEKMPPELRAKWSGRWITFTVQKNRRRKPVTLTLPVLPELEEILEASPCGDLTFLVTSFGRPFTEAGFGNWFRDRCNEAGLNHCTAHGLRQAGATMAAERGATVNQLKAIFGWSTLKQAALYTHAAEQAALAGGGMMLLGKDRNANETVPPARGVQKSGTIGGKKA